MFFTAINQMMTEGVDLTLVIRKANGQMAVSVLPKSNGLKDEAQNHIIPLTLKGVPQELDTGFLQAVARPVQKATGLITNMAQFEAQTEKAASESKVAKDAKAKETKEEKEKREKYEKHLKKAEELIAAKNHKEAVTALGQARLYATEQNRKAVDEKIEEQKRAMNQGSLFDLMEQAEQQPRQQAPQPVAEQKPMAQQPTGQMPPQQPRQYVQQPQQQPAPQPMQGQQPAYHRPAQPQMPPQQPYPYPQQGAYPQGAQGGQLHYEEQMPPYYTERQAAYQHPSYPPQDEPTYRPEDYEEYLDFPADMIRTPHYQHQTA